MRLKFLNTSTVVAAQEHNPTILHPAFLESRKIIPPEWVASGVICTPPVAVVKYNENGFVITVDGGKLQVVDNNPGEHPENSLAPQVASKYISELPHVRYTAVGLNFAGFVEIDGPERRVLERFLKPDPSWQSRFSPKAVGLKFVFPLTNGFLHLSVDAGSVQRENDEKMSGILVNANCHFDLSNGGASLDQAKNILAQFAETYDIAQGCIRSVAGVEN